MFIPQTYGWMIDLLMIIVLASWGSWPCLRKLSTTSSQAFAIVMICSEFMTMCILCGTLGSIVGYTNFPEPAFITSAIEDLNNAMSITSVIMLLLGGMCIAYGDSAASMAIESLGLVVGAPIVFGVSITLGTVLDFVLDDENSVKEAVLVFTAITCVCCAIYIDAYCARVNEDREWKDATVAKKVKGEQVDKVKKTDSPQEELFKDRSVSLCTDDGEIHQYIRVPTDEASSGKCDTITEANAPLLSWKIKADIPRMTSVKLALAGGILSGLWTAFSTAATDVSSMSIYTLYFWFQFGQLLGIVPSIAVQLKAVGHTRTIMSVFHEIAKMSRRDMICASVAGFLISVGYFCYFVTENYVPSTSAFAFGSCSPIVNKIIAFAFNEYSSFSRTCKLYLLASFSLYVLAIFLIYMSTDSETVRR